MKSNLFILSALLLLGVSCSSKQSKEIHSNSQEVVTQTVSEQKVLVVKLTQADFLSKVFDYKANKSKWKYLGDKPCIIDFYADWCAPCRKVAPILGELAKEYEGRVIIYKVDVEAEKELARDLDIQSLPTLLYCPVEGEPQVLMGLQPKENYIKAISEILNVQ